MLNEQVELTGTVHEGVIVIDGGIALPEGQTVRITVDQPSQEESKAEPVNGKTAELAEAVTGSSPYAGLKAASPLGEILLRFAGIADDLPADIAKNHDHYLYGTPKRYE